MTRLRVDTSAGTFEIRLYETQAPQTCSYFLELVAKDQLLGAQAFRMLSDRNAELSAGSHIHVIQFGREDWMRTRHHPVPHEDTRSTGLAHRRWSVSAARFGEMELYGSFFVCMRDEPALDYGGDRHADGQGFAVFGEVSAGFEVLEQIFCAPTCGDLLDPPIAVEQFSIVPPAP